MNDEHIFTTIKAAIGTVMGSLVPTFITPSDSLRQMGANSLDRAEILMQSMEELNVRLPMLSFAEAQNLADIVAVFASALRTKT